MLKTGILNPQLNSLLSRVRHTNLLVIADRGFPYWPMIETIDIALVDDRPTVLQVLDAIRPNFVPSVAMAALNAALLVCSPIVALIFFSRSGASLLSAHRRCL